MTKTLYFWNVKCNNDCKNAYGITELIFMTEVDSNPIVTCGPCNSRVMTNIAFVRSETINE